MTQIDVKEAFPNEDHDETEDPWYPLWCHYIELIYVQSLIPNERNSFEDLMARRRALRVASETLINDYPEFFQYIEWCLDDLTGNGDPICDDYIERYFKDGIPKDFKFHFASTQKYFDNNWEETDAFTGDLL
jgi:hypothetical protein